MSDNGGNIWDILCGFEKGIKIFSVFVFFFLVLTVVSFPALEPGTAAYAVAVWNATVIGVSLIIIAVFYLKCDMSPDHR